MASLNGLLLSIAAGAAESTSNPGQARSLQFLARMLDANASEQTKTKALAAYNYALNYGEVPRRKENGKEVDGIEQQAALYGMYVRNADKEERSDKDRLLGLREQALTQTTAHQERQDVINAEEAGNKKKYYDLLLGEHNQKIEAEQKKAKITNFLRTYQDNEKRIAKRSSDFQRDRAKYQNDPEMIKRLTGEFELDQKRYWDMKQSLGAALADLDPQYGAALESPLSTEASTIDPLESGLVPVPEFGEEKPSSDVTSSVWDMIAGD